jgi:mRNA interferase HigB
MRVIAVRTLRNYARRKKEAEQPLILWYNEACKASWKNSNELKRRFANASIIDGKRIVFNILGINTGLLLILNFIYKSSLLYG